MKPQIDWQKSLCNCKFSLGEGALFMLSEYAQYAQKVDWVSALSSPVDYLKRPLTVVRSFQRKNFRFDFMAGLTVGIVLLPQAIAIALIAELPPATGLYASIVGAFFGALWGSSYQLQTGPVNAISLLVFSSLASVVATGTSEYILAAGLLAVMAGVFQLVMGMLRLGMLVNFVSHSVIVGFATGAGIFIGIQQIPPLLGISTDGETIIQEMQQTLLSLGDMNWQTAVIGLIAMAVMVVSKRIFPKLPGAVFAMVVSIVLVYIFHLGEEGVAVIGAFPRSLPPIAPLPFFNLELIADLSAGALAIGAIGLVQTTAISRSVAAQTGQRLDSNQEFVGQGVANVMMGIFSGFPGAGSFTNTAVNLKAGAVSPMAAVLSAGFALVAMFLFSPIGNYIPRSALAGILIITAVRMVDGQEIRRILQSHPGDAAILIVTFLGTLFLAIEFAVLVGIMLSLVLYILRTSTPRIHAVVPDKSYKHFVYQPERDPCPQLGVIEILGDLYFGAVNNIESFILDHAEKHPTQRYLLLRMHSVNNCDFSGIHMLENVVRVYRERGGDIFLVRTHHRFDRVAEASGFDSFLGKENFLNEDEAISFIFHHILDPAVCIYECPVRVFRECQNLPKRIEFANLPKGVEFDESLLKNVEPRWLWGELHPLRKQLNGTGNGQTKTDGPIIVDVREPREYRTGHIAEAISMPLSTILAGNITLARDRQIILVCRSGRRSRRAAIALHMAGYDNVAVLDGGMIAWEAADLLEAVSL
jgi:SulP family sulfate permease